MSKSGLGSTTIVLSAARSTVCAAAATPACLRNALRGIIGLEVNSPLNQQETVRARRVVGNFAEVGVSGFQAWDLELRPVHYVQSIQAQLEINSLMNRKLALDV